MATLAKQGAALVFSVLWAVAVIAQAASVDYDTFMQQDVNARISTFNKISPENKAEIVRTQLQRWTDANRTRLSAEQLQYIQEALDFLSPELYRQPKSVALVVRSKELESRAAALFAPEDVMHGMTIQGAYIPRSNLRSR